MDRTSNYSGLPGWHFDKAAYLKSLQEKKKRAHMAFCNDTARCGHCCGRQDYHGGDCDCYETDCRYSSRYVAGTEQEDEDLDDEDDTVKQAPVPAPPPKTLATFYAIRSNDKFYRTHTPGRSAGWVNVMEEAKLWTKPGPAKAKITALCSVSKGNVPELVEFIVTEVRVVDQTARVAAVKVTKAREEAARAVAQRERDLKDAKEKLDKAAARLKKLQEG